jgi:hypothetical protein
MFNADVYGNLRRAQGLVRSAAKEIHSAGQDVAGARIAAAVATMRRFDNVRVPHFQALLAQARKQSLTQQPSREIVRRAGNPMLRYARGASPNSTRTPQEK